MRYLFGVCIKCSMVIIDLIIYMVGRRNFWNQKMVLPSNQS